MNEMSRYEWHNKKNINLSFKPEIMQSATN